MPISTTERVSKDFSYRTVIQISGYYRKEKERHILHRGKKYIRSR
jgi:hypothetical protein